MEPISVLIVDDESLARAGLRKMLRDEPGVEIVGECASGEDAVRAINDLRPDVALLDVRMPDLDGFEVLERVSEERRPVVIFMTAYDEYALKAFDAEATDYVLKPVGDSRVKEALRRARERVQQAKLARGEPASSRPDQDRRGATADDPSMRPEYFPIESRGRLYLVPVEQIDWVEADGDHVKLHIGPHSYRIRETLGGMERKLDPTRFVRIHRSTIVQLSQIRELQPFFHGDYVVVLHDGTQLRLARTRREPISRLLQHRL